MGPLPRRGGLLNSEAARVLQQGAVDRVFPGAALSVVDLATGQALIDAVAGVLSHEPAGPPVHRGVLWDVASLTKLFTATVVLQLAGEGVLPLDADASRWLGAAGAGMTIRQLLEHRSGLPAWAPFFQTSWAGGPPVVEQALATEREADPGRHRYSDVGFLTLGAAVERATGTTLRRSIVERVIEPLGLASTGFRPVEQGAARAAELLAAGVVAPTEQCPDRGLVCGEVMDRNCWAMGGAGPHAGLFSTPVDLATFARAWASPESGLVPEELRAEWSSAPAGGHVLGWDTVSPEGYTSAGRGLSPRSRGHLGFAGTSLWIDPDRGVVTVLLTNRTHPDRTHTAIRAFRPCLHDAVARDLGPLPESATSSKGQRRD